VKSFLLPAAALGLVLGGPAAYGQTTTEPSAPAPAPAATEAAASEPAMPMADVTVDTPLADVNGETLTLGQLVALRVQLPEQYQQLPDQVLLDGLTQQVIEHMMLAQAADKAGLASDPMVMLNLKIQNRAIMADAYMRAELAKRITPEAIQTLYDERYVDAPPEKEVRAAHILVDSEEKATALKAEIDGGADFAELAKANGTDGTASRGGELGWFAHGDMVPEFADAAFAMEPGTVSAPVKSAFGWHLILLEEKRDRPAPQLEEVREALAGELAQTEQQAILEELRAQASIVMPDLKVPPEAVRADGLLGEK
jgi:peptidyl-prolyl cis-trans isomerase C